LSRATPTFERRGAHAHDRLAVVVAVCVYARCTVEPRGTRLQQASDRGVAESEQSREGEWKARRQSGSHRRFDVKRRKCGGSNGERRHKKSMQDVELGKHRRIDHLLGHVDQDGQQSPCAMLSRRTRSSMSNRSLTSAIQRQLRSCVWRRSVLDAPSSESIVALGRRAGGGGCERIL